MRRCIRRRRRRTTDTRHRSCTTSTHGEDDEANIATAVEGGSRVSMFEIARHMNAHLR